MIRFDSALAEFWDRGVPVGTLRKQNRVTAKRWERSEQSVLSNLIICCRSRRFMNNPG